MSGSIGGDTHARNRYGNYIRAKTKPINQNASSALLTREPDENTVAKVRAAMAFLADRWSQTVTAAQRTAWNLYGASVAMKNALGEVVYLSGYNHYIRSNSIPAMVGGTIVDSGPTIFELPEKDPTVTVAPQETGQHCALVFDDTMEWVDEDDAALIIREGRPQNPQRNFFKGPFIGFKDKAGSSVAPKTSPEDFTNLQILSAGQRVWYDFRILRADGRLSEPFYADAIVITGS